MTFGHLPIVFFGLFSSIFKCSVPFKQYSLFVSDVRYFLPNYHLSFDFAYGRFLSKKKVLKIGNTLAVQWLGLHAVTAEGPDLIPDQRTEIPQAVSEATKKKNN